MIGWFYYVATTAVRFYFWLLTHWQIEGLDNVPKKGAILVVANHLSNADPPLVSVSLKRKAIFMAKEELFRPSFLGYFMYRTGAFPVHRGQLDRKALRHAERVLSEDYALVMFPEATRSKNARLQPAYPGSALIAMRNNVPILPLAITGTEKLIGWKWLFRRQPIILRFGKPFHLPPVKGKRSREDLEESTGFIMEHIAELLPVEYRGIYAKKERRDGPAD